MELNRHETLYGSLKVYIFFVSDQKIMMAAIIRHCLLGKIGFFKFQISCFQKPDMCWKCYLERRYPYMIIPIKKKKIADQKSKVLTRVK